MYRYLADIYTEPEPDTDTLANLGPLTGLAGIWSRDAGEEVNPKPDGPEHQRFIERYELQPIDAQGRHSRGWRFPVVVLVGVILGTGACSRKDAPAVRAQAVAQSEPAVQPERQFRLVATIQDLMEGQIDPSADALWDSVAYIATEAGIEDRRPHTDEQWRALRRSAVTLIETINLLCMPGRRVAVAGTPAGFGELSPAQIQRRIQADHDRFAQFARVLQEAGLKALTAIDAKDAQALMDAGGVIDEACEACHVAYWYPDQHSPGN